MFYLLDLTTGEFISKHVTHEDAFIAKSLNDFLLFEQLDIVYHEGDYAVCNNFTFTNR